MSRRRAAFLDTPGTGLIGTAVPSERTVAHAEEAIERLPGDPPEQHPGRGG